mmetsp:Transcript_139363/g.445697  ORF Transcript_139363/g.445697 Transcript_139363/m.445697 type:complete len:490 (-) Transcript_139363:227-1696(-)
MPTQKVRDALRPVQVPSHTLPFARLHLLREVEEVELLRAAGLHGLSYLVDLVVVSPGRLLGDPEQEHIAQQVVRVVLCDGLRQDHGLAEVALESGNHYRRSLLHERSAGRTEPNAKLFAVPALASRTMWQTLCIPSILFEALVANCLAAARLEAVLPGLGAALRGQVPRGQAALRSAGSSTKSGIPHPLLPEQALAAVGTTPRPDLTPRSRLALRLASLGALHVANGKRLSVPDVATDPHSVARFVAGWARRPRAKHLARPRRLVPVEWVQTGSATRLASCPLVPLPVALHAVAPAALRAEATHEVPRARVRGKAGVVEGEDVVEGGSWDELLNTATAHARGTSREGKRHQCWRCWWRWRPRRAAGPASAASAERREAAAANVFQPAVLPLVPASAVAARARAERQPSVLLARQTSAGPPIRGVICAVASACYAHCRAQLDAVGQILRAGAVRRSRQSLLTAAEGGEDHCGGRRAASHLGPPPPGRHRW